MRGNHVPLLCCISWTMACQLPTDPPASMQAPPPLELTGEPLFVGQPSRLRVSGADPGRPIHWIASLATDGDLACPPPLGGTCLDLVSPTRVMGRTTARANGRSVLTLTPPMPLGDRPVRLQAVQMVGGQPHLSPVLDTYFYDPHGDLDGDGLDNFQELVLHETDPHETDTDLDGTDDFTEIQAGTDPLDPLDGGSECAPDVTMENIAPGGAGVFTHVSRHPIDPSILFFGTDVGGVFRSFEEGVSADKLTRHLPVKQVHDLDVSVDITGSERLLLATVMGMYRSDDLGDTWVESWDGVVPTTDSWTFPASVVAVAPQQPDVVWATIGEHDITEEYRYQDPWIVYRSEDRGETWTGVLSLDLPDPSVAEIQTGILTEIVFDPEDSSVVYVPSSRGLLVTYDDGVTWFELGRGAPRISEDHGDSWLSCDDAAADCPAWMTTATCTQGVDCLPLRDDAGAERTELRDIAVHHVGDETWLTAVVDNPDFFNDTCTGTKTWDHDLTQMTSGPYRSTDGGLTWSYMFHPDDDDVVRNYGRYVACDVANSGGWNDTTFLDIAANPDDPDDFFLATKFLLGGIIAYRDGTFQHLSREVCPDYDCFEGGRSQGLWAQQQGPGAFDFEVYDWEQEHPTLYWTHSRGILRGDWSEDEGRYRFELLESDPVDEEATRWTGYGLDDFCSVAMLTSEDSQELYVTAADAGLVRSLDGGESWSLHPANLGNDDEAYAIARDPETGWLYLPRFQTGTDSHSLTLSTDGGETWSFLGGYCAGGCDERGFDPANFIYAVAIDYSSSPDARRVLVGTKQGLVLYDPSVASDPFTDVRDGGCPVADHRVHQVLTWPERPGLALFTALDHSTNALAHGATDSVEGGVYLLDMTSGVPSCTYLLGPGDEPRAPTRLAVAQRPDGTTTLVATGTWFYDARGYTTSFDFDHPEAVSWSRTMGFVDMYGSDGDPLDSRDAFDSRDFSAIAVDPRDPRIVVVGMSGNPYFHGYVQPHAFVSYDGGETWGTAFELAELPDKDIELLHFSPDGQYLYVGPSCGSLLRMTNPFGTGCEDGARCEAGTCLVP